jgi:7-cyano-7-deazaguanine synthase
MGSWLRALLLSGGVESTALAFGEQPDLCLTIDYGQPSAMGELRASRAIASYLKLKHVAVKVDLYASLKQPEHELRSWWPYRNQALITLAGIHLAAYELEEVLVGFVKDDIYKDCTAAFVDAVNGVLALQEKPFVVTAPGASLSTVSLLSNYQVPLELLNMTLSCHTGRFACGQCPGCLKNKAVMRQYRRRSKLELVASR